MSIYRPAHQVGDRIRRKIDVMAGDDPTNFRTGTITRVYQGAKPAAGEPPTLFDVTWDQQHGGETSEGHMHLGLEKIPPDVPPAAPEVINQETMRAWMRDHPLGMKKP